MMCTDRPKSIHIGSSLKVMISNYNKGMTKIVNSPLKFEKQLKCKFFPLSFKVGLVFSTKK